MWPAGGQVLADDTTGEVGDPVEVGCGDAHLAAGVIVHATGWLGLLRRLSMVGDGIRHDALAQAS